METFYLRLKAPFAAYRYFQAGVYRSTMPTMPHSAAWGLINNIIGVETRINTNDLTTQISSEVPPICLAVGNVTMPELNSMYQQLHVIPVGTSGKENAPRTKGTKYFIRPVRREFLTGLDMLLGIKSEDSELKNKLISGLNGEFNEARYGLPFAGDNNLLFDSIEVMDQITDPAYWYSIVGEDDSIDTDTTRLTVKIDRLDNSETISPLFAITKKKSPIPPDSAWVWTPNLK